MTSSSRRSVLTALQHGMLLHSVSAPEEGAYVQQKRLTLHEPIDVPAFTRAVGELVDAHPVLRTVFELDDPAEPVQRVLPYVEVDLDVRDWRGFGAAERKKRMQCFLDADRRDLFDFTVGPPLRFVLFRTGDAEYEFVWTSHHALMDGRCYAPLLVELFQRYESVPVTDPSRRPFVDYLTWLSEQDFSAAEDFWRSTLAHLSEPTSLADEAGRVDGAVDDVHATKTAELPYEITGALQTLAERHRVSVNSIVQGAWAVLLSRRSGNPDVLFGTTWTCRSSAGGTQDTIGLLVNTLPFHVEVDVDATVGEFLRRLHESHRALRDLVHTPLTRIRQWSQVPPHLPLFDSVVIFENHRIDSLLRKTNNSWRNRWFHLEERTHYALALYGYQDEGLLLKLGHDRRRFSDATAELLLGQLLAILTAMLQDPHAVVRELVVPAKRNETTTAYPDDKCVHQLFDEQARRRPDAPAVVCEGRTETYEQLNRRSNQLATLLGRSGVGPGALVGVCLERSTDLVVSLLGLMKSGAAYVPLDPTFPADRIAAIVEDTGSPLLLTQASLADTLRGCGATVVVIEELWQRVDLAGAYPYDHATADDLAYVIYTSGSTGQPKGVQVGHRALTNLLCSMARTPGFTEQDRMLAITTICFDIAALELYLPLVTGGQVEVVPSHVAADGFALHRRLLDSRPTVMQATPATWRMLITAGWSRTPWLTVLCGGEALPRDLADDLLHRTAGVWNLYGPTECTIWSSIDEVEPGERITIGRPIANTRFHVLDARMRPVHPGVPGELHIGGHGVAGGYLNRPELTGQKFVQSPFGDAEVLYRTGDLVRELPDGRLEYLDRIDDQLKINGFRVEPGEIETTLRRHPAVSEAVVAVREETPGDRRLVAYCVRADPETDLPVAEIREHLAARIPRYLVPAVFVPLERVPLTPNGKVDRKALPRLNAPARSGPDTGAEGPVATIWQRVLGLSTIGLDDNFFDLGGDSLLLMHLVKELRSEFQIPLTSVDVLQHPTVRTMRRHLDLARQGRGARSVPRPERPRRRFPRVRTHD